MLERLARWCFHRRRFVLVLWIVAFVAFGVFGNALNGGYTQSADLPGSDAIAAFNLLKHRFPQQSGDSVLVVFKADRGIDDPAVRPRVDALLSQLSRQPHVSGVTRGRLTGSTKPCQRRLAARSSTAAPYRRFRATVTTRRLAGRSRKEPLAHSLNAPIAGPHQTW